MYGSKTNSYVLIIFLIPLLLFNACKRSVDLNSKWVDKEIVIDADDHEWKDYPFYYDEETQSRIGLFNDDENLYICFQIINEEVQKQIDRQGLVVWFNETGDKEKQLGISYPLGKQPRGFGGPMGKPSGMPGSRRDRSSDMSGRPSDMESGDKKMSPERPFGQGFDSMEDIEILPSDDVTGFLHNPERAAKIGIYARCAIDERGRFLYELKMPLMKTEETRFAVSTSAVKKIGIGFMTGEVEKTSGGGMGKGRRPGRGRPSGGPGGGGPGGGGPGGGRPGGGMPGRGADGGPDGDKETKGEGMEIWTHVALASSP